MNVSSGAKDPKRAEKVLWAAVLIFAAGLAVFLLQHIDRLSLWMDEGFHYLAAEGILHHGYPLFPSGHVYFKAIFYCYALALFALVLGLKTFTLRLVSVLAFAALVPVVYGSVKRWSSRTAGLLAALAIAFSAWGIEYARTALYFAPLQLAMILGLYVFYRGYFEDIKKYKLWSWVVFLLIPHIHQLGESVAFAFAALLLVKGLKRFLRRDVLVFASVIFVYYAAIQLWEFFFWQVGYVYERTETGPGGLLSYFFSGFSMSYFRELARSFPLMSLAVLGGGFFLLATFRRNGPSEEAGGNSADSRLAYLYLNLLFPLLFLGFFRTHVQPRYLAHLFPLFVILFVLSLERMAPAIVRLLADPFLDIRKESLRRGLAFAVFLALSLLLVEGVGWKKASAIVNRRYQEAIGTDIITRSGRLEQEDYRTTGEYVRRFLRDSDIVIAIHVVFSKIYAGRVDYWLWSGGPGTWDAWEKTADGWKDFYVGARWLNNLDDLKKVIESNPGKRVWVITSPSIDRRDHIRQEIADFIRSDPARRVFRGQDGTSEVYLWHDAAGELAGPGPAFEGEWIVNAPGTVDYLEDASRKCALRLGKPSEKAGAVSFVLPFPGTYPLGGYTCRVRLKSTPDGGGSLAVAVFSRKRKEKIRSLTLGEAGHRLGASFETRAFDLFLDKEDAFDLRFHFSGRAPIWLDSVDLVPKEN